MANVQPKVNNFRDRDEQEEALPTSIVVIDISILFLWYICVYLKVTYIGDSRISINQHKRVSYMYSLLIKV